MLVLPAQERFSVKEVERVRAMVGQALAEARTRGAARVTALHLVMYDDSAQALEEVQQALAAVTPGTWPWSGRHRPLSLSTAATAR